MTLDQLKAMFQAVGVTKLYAKVLAGNDNSKNQVYLGPDFKALNLFPNTGIFPDSSTKNPIFKADLNFRWLLDDGRTVIAPGAKFILYPQYPEVRFSGFLKGCPSAPSKLMTAREQDRILFLGPTSDRCIIGHVVSADSEIARQFRGLGTIPSIGVFFELNMPRSVGEDEARTRLLNELCRIYRLGWIESKQLSEDGTIGPCNAPQCGGFTLEAELGIPKNSSSEPDFMGWEVKQYSVDRFDRIESAKPITLMTPEPDGGFYRDHSIEEFVWRYGYADKTGRPDRMNFGGRHYANIVCPPTGLKMELSGFDAATGKITNTAGAIELTTKSGEIAASWSFAKLLEHWAHKHNKAVYVPSMCQKEPFRQYWYGCKVRLAQRTDGLRLLSAFAGGAVYYDPGIKLENVSSVRPKAKKRSQFRTTSRQIAALYEQMETVQFE